jgi:Zn ribbon nucleic-acid-binding protein
MKKKVTLDRNIEAYEFYQEVMIKFSDLDYQHISNDRARHLLGSHCRIPRERQSIVLEQMIKCGFLKRENQKVLEQDTEYEDCIIEIIKN